MALIVLSAPTALAHNAKMTNFLLKHLVTWLNLH